MKKIEIKLPDELLIETETKLRNSEFVTMDELVTYLLQRYIDDKSERQNPVAEVEIKKRLKNLGYL